MRSTPIRECFSFSPAIEKPVGFMGESPGYGNLSPGLRRYQAVPALDHEAPVGADNLSGDEIGGLGSQEKHGLRHVLRGSQTL